MWLMEERIKLEALGEAVKLIQFTLDSQARALKLIDEKLERRRQELVTVEARVDRLEQSPSIQKRRVIPSGSSSLSAPSSDSARED